MMNKFIHKMKTFKERLRHAISRDKYYLVYKCANNKIKTYLIGNINLYKSFGNKNEGRDNAGFRAYCFARQQTRSFRHDRIVSLTKK